MGNRQDVIILDDHSLFLQGLSSLIEECIPGCNVRSFRSLRELRYYGFKPENTALFVSDIELPGEDVFELFRELKDKNKEIPVMVVSMHKKLSVIRKCKDLGIEGYLLKDDDVLFDSAVSAVLAGEEFYSPRVEDYFKSFPPDEFTLSLREEEILKKVCKGYSNMEISDELCISVETVKSHKKNIKIKLACDNSSELIQYAQEHLIL